MEEDGLSDPIPICEEYVEDGESLSSTTTVKGESCNIKPPRPPVPPKPSKSKETSLGQILVVPLPEVLPCQDQNQSLQTDDEPAGDNLALESPSSISESFHLSQHTNNPASGDESAGNPSQVSVIEEADSKSLSPNSMAEAINQDHLITASPSDSTTDANVPTTSNAAAAIAKTDCPFQALHYRTPEILSYPEILKQNDKSILFGIDDFSSKLEQKIDFIVQNLKDCGGIWPIMFIEKLNKIIVRCELSPLQLYFHENSGILKQLLESFDQEKRCSMVFRYWCTFYNILARREIISSYTLAWSSLLSRLQRDFILASCEVCRCSEGSAPLAAVVPKENSQYSDDQHPLIEFEKQLEVLAILMIPLMTSRAETERTDLDTVPENPDPKTFMKAIMNGMNLFVKKGTNMDLASLNVTRNLQPAENSNLLVESMKSVAYVICAQKATLVNLLMAYNLEFADKEYNPVAQVIANDDSHKRFIRNYAISTLKKEFKLIETGNFKGIAALYPPVVGIQMTGVRGPMKLLLSLLKQDETLFGLETVEFLLCIAQEIRDKICQEESKSHLDEGIINQIVKDCGDMNALLESRYASCRIEYSPGTSCSQTRLGGGGDWKSSILRNRSISGSMGSLSSYSHDSEEGSSGSSASSSVWAIGDVLKNCFGCSKSKKKVQTTVCPASNEDIEEISLAFSQIM